MIAFSSSIFWTGLGEKVKHYIWGPGGRGAYQGTVRWPDFLLQTVTISQRRNKINNTTMDFVSKGMECNVCHTFAINYVPINCDCGQWMRMPSEITWTGLSWNMSSGIIVTINTFSLPHSHKSHRSRGRKDQKVLHCAIKTSEDTQQDGGYGWGSHSDSMLWPTDRLYLLMKLLTRNAGSFLNNL